MVHLLLRQRVNDRIPGLLPADVQAAHKTGNLPGIVNDVGILYGPSTTVAVAALISDTSDETAAANAIARVALITYSYFDAQPDSADRPALPLAPNRSIPPVWREPRPVPTAAPEVAPEPASFVAPAGVAPTMAPTSLLASPTPPAPPTPLPAVATPLPAVATGVPAAGAASTPIVAATSTAPGARAT